MGSGRDERSQPVLDSSSTACRAGSTARSGVAAGHARPRRRRRGQAPVQREPDELGHRRAGRRRPRRPPPRRPRPRRPRRGRTARTPRNGPRLACRAVAAAAGRRTATHSAAPARARQERLRPSARPAGRRTNPARRAPLRARASRRSASTHVAALERRQGAERQAGRPPSRSTPRAARRRPRAPAPRAAGEVAGDPADERLELDQDAVPVGRVRRLRLLEQRRGLGHPTLEREAEREPSEHDREAIRLVVLAGDRLRAPQRRLPFGERAAEVGAEADRGQALHRDEPIADRVGGFDDRSGVGAPSPQGLPAGP